MDHTHTMRRCPATRYVYHDAFRYFYAMGNTAARDILEHVASGKEPAILVLGCGDFRGCIYSLWKHFDPASSLHHFHGVHFVLNDHSPAMLARNILYLYYVSQMPPWKEEEAAKQWISNLWAVWYCHELLPSHERSLKEALTVLVRSSTSLETWRSSADNPLRNIVSFSNSETLQKIRPVWEMWRTKSFGTLEALHYSRMEEFKQKLAEVSTVGGMDAHVIPSITTFLGVLRTTDISREEIDSLGCDYTEYLESGSSYAEDIFNLPHSTSHTFINPTLFDNEDANYTLQYASAPFRSFYHILEVSKCEVQKLGMSVTIAGQPLVVEDDSFQRHPLLSNCIQQFSIWVSSAAATLRAQSSRMKPNVSFTFDCSHCILFCEEIHSNPKLFLAQSGFEPVFDVIYTSNLIDSITAPVMVYTTFPLLKPDGVMVCRTTLYTYIGQTPELYLEGQFGFSPELFPLMFGGRCLGQEGKYADTNSNEPVPVSIMTILGNIKQAQQNPTKELFFAKVNPTPYKMASLTEFPPILDALHGAVHVATASFLLKENGLITKLGMCTETAVQALLTFTTLLESSVDFLDYQFWEPLSTRLREDTNLKPIMVHLQTQLLLHNLHLHLVFSKENCPICVGIPVLKVISQYSTIVDPNPKGSPEKSAPFFGALIHKTTLPTWLPMHELRKLKVPVHLVESMQGRLLPSKKVALDFFFPTGLADEGYKVTIVRYDVGIHPHSAEMSNVSIPIPILECKLRELDAKEMNYFFKQAGAVRMKNAPSNLGSYLSHWGDAEHMETVVSLTFDTIAMMKTANLKTKRVSSTVIEVNCQDLCLATKYPYPVDYSKVTTKLNKKNGTLLLKVPRRNYLFYEERSMFMVNPDNKLIFPPLPVSQTVYSTISGMQFNRKERTIFEVCRKDNSPMPAPLNVKDWLISFLKQSNKLFTVHSNPDPVTGEKSVWLLIAIHSRVFDTTRQTPSLDLSYCIMEESIFPRVFQQWRIVSFEPSLTPAAEVVADKEDYMFLCHMLKYYTSRTYKSSKNPSHMLRKYHLDQYFTRAMVYPLYCDPDRFLLDLEIMKSNKESILPVRNVPFPPWSSLNPANARPTVTTTQGKVPDKFLSSSFIPASSHSGSSASKRSFPTIDEAQDPIPHSPMEEPSECSFCGNTSEKLRKCTGCGSTWYCGKECQTRHWKQHKAVCKPPVIPIAMALPSKCASCGKDSANLKRCACQFVAYCSKECQRNDWARHRTNCTATARSKK